MIKNRLTRKPRLALHRAVPLTALAAVMAATIVVTPSIAGSVLSPEKAKRTYLTRKAASKLYVKTKGSHNLFLTNKSAKKTYVAKTELPAQPTAFINSSSVDFAPVQSETAVPIPSSTLSFEVPTTSKVVLTFSGQATCTGDDDGVGCPVQLLIDEQGTGEGKSNFALSSSADPAPAPLANTLTTTTVLTAGPHTASVAYAGSTDESLKFGLKDLNLAVEAFPDID